MQETGSTQRSAVSATQGLSVLGILFAGFILSQLIGAEVVSVASRHFGHVAASVIQDRPEHPWWFTVSAMAGLWTGFALTFLFANLIVRPTLPAGFFRFKVSDLRFVGLGVLAQWIVGLLYYPFHAKSTGNPVKQVVGHNPTWGMIAIVAFVGLGAPIIEELLFRGTLLPAITGIVGERATVLTRGLLPAAVTGVIFGLAHGELVQLAGLALVGTLLGFLVQRTQRIWPAILTHAGFNLIAILVAWASVATK